MLYLKLIFHTNIPQGMWKYSISDILTSKNAQYSKFGMLIVKYEIYRMH